MARTDDLYALPPNLPAPVDDGACGHLTGMEVPDLALPSTGGRRVSLAAISRRSRVVVYCYPRTGRTDQDPPQGWNDIPGARGCTPQSCGFRDHYEELRRRGVEVFGLSTQDTEYQREMVERLRLPFEVLSDADLKLTSAMRLPTFKVESMTLVKRLTLILVQGRVERVFYPVFPPDKNADDVVRWLTGDSRPGPAA
jgi:peroxiredoxin